MRSMTSCMMRTVHSLFKDNKSLQLLRFCCSLRLSLYSDSIHVDSVVFRSDFFPHFATITDIRISSFLDFSLWKTSCRNKPITEALIVTFCFVRLGDILDGREMIHMKKICINPGDINFKSAAL